MAAILLWKLPDTIQDAKYLTQSERNALEAEVARHHSPGPIGNDLPGALALIKKVVKNPYYYLIFPTGFMIAMSASVYIAYTPIIISNLLRGTALGNATVAAAKGARDLRPVGLSVIPFFLAAVFSYLLAASSQKRDELFYHISGMLVPAGVLMALFSPLARWSVAAGFAALTLSLAMSFATNGPGLTVISRLCHGNEHIVALPLSNAFAIVGAIVGPLITGAIMRTPVSRLKRETGAGRLCVLGD
jgi:hypothetical protein